MKDETDAVDQTELAEIEAPQKSLRDRLAGVKGASSARTSVRLAASIPCTMPVQDEDTGQTLRVPCLIAAFRAISDVTGIHRIRVDEPERWPKTSRKSQICTSAPVASGALVRTQNLRERQAFWSTVTAASPRGRNRSAQCRPGSGLHPWLRPPLL